MRVLLSINPPHVENIMTGKKKFEFRRKIFARPDVRTIVIYCTQPIGKIVGEFDVAAVLEEKPDRLWKLTKEGSGISKKYFDSYFEGRTYAFALKIGQVREFIRHINPRSAIDNFTPPQSFMYLPHAIGGHINLSGNRNWHPR